MMRASPNETPMGMRLESGPVCMLMWVVKANVSRAMRRRALAMA